LLGITIKNKIINIINKLVQILLDVAFHLNGYGLN
jgi:hypothetical protein